MSRITVGKPTETADPSCGPSLNPDWHLGNLHRKELGSLNVSDTCLSCSISGLTGHGTRIIPTVCTGFLEPIPWGLGWRIPSSTRYSWESSCPDSRWFDKLLTPHGRPYPLWGEDGCGMWEGGQSRRRGGVYNWDWYVKEKTVLKNKINVYYTQEYGIYAQITFFLRFLNSLVF